ncbi:hypothetical protein BC628DRAFT_782917 [Trametes gibbosa]|nr:hypothetical protein BC628DRAFT_782917 [Trametes gibbosa]
MAPGHRTVRQSNASEKANIVRPQGPQTSFVSSRYCIYRGGDACGYRSLGVASTAKYSRTYSLSAMAGRKPGKGEAERSWQWRFDRHIVAHTIPPHWALSTPYGQTAYHGTRLESINNFYRLLSLTSSDFNLVCLLLLYRRYISSRTTRRTAISGIATSVP